MTKLYGKHFTRNWYIAYTKNMRRMYGFVLVWLGWLYPKSSELLHYDGLVQDCCNSSALAMELLQSCTKPSTSTGTIIRLESLTNLVVPSSLSQISWGLEQIAECAICFEHKHDIFYYPMLRADSRFWLVNNREIWRRISRLTSSAWDIKTKECHWWRHNGDSDRRPLSLPLRYDLVTLCLCGDWGQINVIAGILKLQKHFRMSQILFEHGINSLSLVCYRGYRNLSTLRPLAARGIAMLCVDKFPYPHQRTRGN